MIILKLLLVLLFVYFSSKSLGIFISKKSSLSYAISLGIGYMLNIAIFLLCSFIPMYFRLSSNYLMIFGSLYMVLCFVSMWFAIKDKSLFKFSRKEVLALLIASIFTILFALFVDFGYADMYDSYFYSILSNSASNTDKLSMINPYNGISDLQTFYKYISFYLEPSFFANILHIAPAYLVLIWPFTFMSYFLIAITALGVARISKEKHINNIVSIFVLTMYTSFFRAPFNYLHAVNILIPIYLFYFAFRALRDKKFIWIYYIAFASAAACSSAILYTSAAFILALFISSTIKRDYDKLDIIFKLAIPTYFLGVLYMLESNRSIIAVIASILFVVVIFYLIKLRPVKLLARLVGISLIVLIPTLFIYTPFNKDLVKYAENFMGQGAVGDKLATTSKYMCIKDTITVENVNLDTDNNMFGTAMHYIYEDSKSPLNTGLIMITHSVFMYGGLLFFGIYGFFKKRRKHVFKIFIIYLLLFFNPLVSDGLAILTLNLNSRIYLFFNTFYAIYGIVWFFEWVESLNIKFINKCIEYFYIPYAILLGFSIYSYIAILKTPDLSNLNLLYKMPNNLVEANVEVNDIVSKKIDSEKPIVLYSIDTLSLSTIDINPNDNYKLIDSKMYKDYYFEPDTIINQMLFNLYFESNGKYDFKEIKSNIVNGSYNEKNCGINTMLKDYKVDYIVLGSKYRNSYDKIKENYEIVYDKHDVLVFKRSE